MFEVPYQSKVGREGLKADFEKSLEIAIKIKSGNLNL